MSKTRKILGLVMAVALVLNILAIAVFAGDDANWDPTAVPNPTYTSTWALTSAATETTPAANETFTVDVKLTTDYLAGPVQFGVEYTSSAFEFVSANYATATYPYDEVPPTIKAEAANGVVKVGIIPGTNGLTTLPAVAFDNIIATLTFKLIGSGGTIGIQNDPKRGENGDEGYLCAMRLVGTTDIIQAISASNWAWGQAQVTDAAPLTIGTPVVAQPDLAVKAGVTGVVINTAKTFGGTYDGVVYGFTQAAAMTFRNKNYLNNSLEATNSGSLEIVASSGTNFCGTGTLINVKSGNDTVKTYVVVIFGDLNGDGMINSTDLGELVKASKNATYFPNNSLKRMAANVSTSSVALQLHLINSADIAVLNLHTKSSSNWISQSATAARITASSTHYS